MKSSEITQLLKEKPYLKSLYSKMQREEKRGAPLMQPYSQNYDRICKIIPNIKIIHQSIHHHAGKSAKDPDSGFMDLHFDLTQSGPTRSTFALSHYYKQNGDMIADPDMILRIDFEMKTLEALTFQDYRSFQEVYPIKDGKQYVNLRLESELNRFLSMWLKNLIAQKHIINL